MWIQSTNLSWHERPTYHGSTEKSSWLFVQICVPCIVSMKCIKAVMKALSFRKCIECMHASSRKLVFEAFLFILLRVCDRPTSNLNYLVTDFFRVRFFYNVLESKRNSIWICFVLSKLLFCACSCIECFVFKRDRVTWSYCTVCLDRYSSIIDLLLMFTVLSLHLLC